MTNETVKQQNPVQENDGNAVTEPKHYTVTFDANDINMALEVLRNVSIQGSQAVRFATALNILETKGTLIE